MYLTKEIWYGRKLTGDFIVERGQAQLLWGVRVKWGAAENLFLRVTQYYWAEERRGELASQTVLITDIKEAFICLPIPDRTDWCFSTYLQELIKYLLTPTRSCAQYILMLKEKEDKDEKPVHDPVSLNMAFLAPG